VQKNEVESDNQWLFYYLFIVFNFNYSDGGIYANVKIAFRFNFLRFASKLLCKKASSERLLPAFQLESHSVLHQKVPHLNLEVLRGKIIQIPI